MQDAASVLTDPFGEVLARLPAGLDLDDLAMESKAIQRRREVVDGAALLRIALARGPGSLSLRQTAARAELAKVPPSLAGGMPAEGSMQGIAELSNPGVKYRLDQATEFLAAGTAPRSPRARRAYTCYRCHLAGPKSPRSAKCRARTAQP